MKNQPPSHPRVADLGALIDILNAWAMAPKEPSRIKGLKAALNRYSKAVGDKRYAPMNKDFCTRTEASYAVPPVVPDSFEYHFGKPKQDTSNKLPWED